MSSHVITTAMPTHTTTGPDSKYYMAQFNGDLDNLVAAATNSGESLNQLAATTTTQYSEIKSLLATLKTAPNRASIPSSYAAAAVTEYTPSIPPTDAKHCIIQLYSAVRNNWDRGDFCSTHSWGVNENHTSKNCRAKKSDHVSTATRAHPTGPGRAINKGWDYFLSRRVSTCT